MLDECPIYLFHFTKPVTLSLKGIYCRCFLTVKSQLHLSPWKEQYTTFVLYIHYLPISSNPKGSVHQDIVHHVHHLDDEDHSQWCIGYTTGQQAINVKPAYGHIVQNSVCLAFHWTIWFPVIECVPEITRLLEQWNTWPIHCENAIPPCWIHLLLHKSAWHLSILQVDPWYPNELVMMSKESNHNMVHAVDHQAYADPCSLLYILRGYCISIVSCMVQENHKLYWNQQLYI